jgi:ribonuclease BN (tRNA processing enzyme)
MELEVLGSWGSWPAPGEATSGYLLRDSGFTMILDLGTGTFAKLQQTVSPLDVGAAIITHAHPDHFVDLYALFYFRFFHPEPLPPLPLYAPPGLLDAVTCFAGPSRAQEIRGAFELHEITGGRTAQIGPFHIRAHVMEHEPATVGVRVSAAGRTLAYTADSGPTDEILTLAQGTDLLLAEATWLHRDARPFNHLSAHQAGEYARVAGVGALTITHLRPPIDPDEAAAEAAASFGRTVTSARSGLRVQIG